jgi:hypothetical protein
MISAACGTLKIYWHKLGHRCGIRAPGPEVSAWCHDEEANFLALNLMHDIVAGAKDVEQARS